MPNGTYVEREATVEETAKDQQDSLDLQQKRIRSQRDALLKDTDWTQVPDSPADAAAWATYRQALRDITGQEGFPSDVTWPEKPV
jgi:hypothetical protein